MGDCRGHFGYQLIMIPKNENPHFSIICQKKETYIERGSIFGVDSKFQPNQTIRAQELEFQRKSIILFGTAVLTLNIDRNDFGWSQMKGVSPRNSFT